MEVCDSDYNYRLVIDPVDDSIGKAGKQTPSDSLINFGRSQWEGHDSANCAIEFVKEVTTQFLLALAVPRDSIINFVLGEFQKPDSHRSRCFDITCS